MILEDKTHLLNLLLSNKPGICEIFVIDKEEVISMPTRKDMLRSILPNASKIALSTINLKPGAGWLKVSNDNHADSQLEEKESPSPHRKTFIYEIAFLLPNDTEEKGQIIRAYDYRKWLVAVKESTGAVRLLGTKERGADYISDFTTGTQMQHGNKYNNLFRWQSGFRALYTIPFDQDVILVLALISNDSVDNEVDVLCGVKNATMPYTVTLQVWVDGEWIDVGTFDITTAGSFSEAITGTQYSNDATHARLVSSDGHYSNILPLVPQVTILIDGDTGEWLTDGPGGPVLEDE